MLWHPPVAEGAATLAKGSATGGAWVIGVEHTVSDMPPVRLTPPTAMMQSVDTLVAPWDDTAVVDTEFDITLQPVRLTLELPENVTAPDTDGSSARTQALEAFWNRVTERVFSTSGVLMKIEEKKRGTFSEISTSMAWLVWCVPDCGGLLTVIEPWAGSNPLAWAAVRASWVKLAWLPPARSSTAAA